jgi:hypothetical protein
MDRVAMNPRMLVRNMLTFYLNGCCLFSSVNTDRHLSTWKCRCLKRFVWHAKHRWDRSVLLLSTMKSISWEGISGGWTSKRALDGCYCEGEDRVDDEKYCTYQIDRIAFVHKISCVWARRFDELLCRPLRGRWGVSGIILDHTIA